MPFSGVSQADSPGAGEGPGAAKRLEDLARQHRRGDEGVTANDVRRAASTLRGRMSLIRFEKVTPGHLE
jgi:hypothetical protein